VDPGRQGGLPVISGTRFRISQLFSELAEGDSVAEIADNLALDADKVKGILVAFSRVMDYPLSPAILSDLDRILKEHS
jgi:uncharacterized protein (DUF433 family)